MLRCAPSVAVNVYLPKDRVTNMHQQYGFVEYRGEEDADYVRLATHVHDVFLGWMCCQITCPASACKSCALICHVLTEAAESVLFEMCCMDMVQAIKVLNMIKLFGKAIRVNKASQDKDTLDVGANLFIGNLDPDVDEKVFIFFTAVRALQPLYSTLACHNAFLVFCLIANLSYPV